MKKIVVFALFMLMAQLSGAAVFKSVTTVSAGTLASFLTAGELTTVTDLTVTGPINSLDFTTMNSSMTALTSIDLSNASIKAYGALPDNWVPNAAFGGMSRMTNIVLPSTTVKIHDFAFNACSGLTGITLPSSLEIMGNGIFKNCTGLTSIVIPQNINSIAGSAFVGCSNLASITVDANNANFKAIDNVVFNKSGSTMVIVPATKSGTFTIPLGVTTFGSETFNGCNNITEINIPASVNDILTGSFSSLSGLKSIVVDAANANYSSADGVLFNKDKSTLLRYPAAKTGAYTIPTSVTKLNTGSFQYCLLLENIIVPSNVNDIGNNVFSGCKALKTAVVNNSVTSLGSQVFNNCSALTSATLPENSTIKTLPSGTFWGCSSLASIVVPDNYTAFSTYCFKGCSKLTTITIPANLLTIGGNSFSNCDLLTDINLPNTVTALGDYSFYECNKLANVHLSSSLLTIGNNCFYSCALLEEITIPASVITIGNTAFAECTGLKKITALADNPVNLSAVNNVFFNVNKTLCVLYVKDATARTKYRAALQWKDFNTIAMVITNMNLPVAPNLNVYSKNGQLTIDGLISNNRLLIYNIKGQIVVDEMVNSTTQTYQLEKGIYFIHTSGVKMKVSL